MRKEAIENFPPGTWVVRWFDRAIPNVHGTGSPGISVQLVRVPEALANQRLSTLSQKQAQSILQYGTPDPSWGSHSGKAMKAAEEAGNLVERECLAGSIPRFAIGTVFCDGKPVGSLPLPVWTFEMSIRPDEILITGAWEKYSDILPKIGNQYTFNNTDFLHRVINDFSYSVHNATRCLIISQYSRVLILPCAEVFRGYYGVGTELANAFLTKPWLDAAAELAGLPRDNEATPAPPPGDLPVDPRDDVPNLVLRRPLSQDSATMLAHFLLDPAGKRAAGQLFAQTYHQLKRVPATSLAAALTPDGFLTARIPFGWDRLKIRVRGIPLLNDGPVGPTKILGLEIVGTEWLGPRDIIALEPAIEKPKVTPGDRKRKSRRKQIQGGSSGDGTVPAGQTEDAGKGSEIDIELPGSRWFNPPRVRKKKFKVPTDEERQ